MRSICAIGCVVGLLGCSPGTKECPDISTDMALPEVSREPVVYATSPLKLEGLLYWPGRGRPTARLPVVVWNHGSETVTIDERFLAEFYTRRGFVFFLPIRRGHSIANSSVASEGQAIDDATNELEQRYPNWQSSQSTLFDQGLLALQELDALDVQAAVAWVGALDFVDADRMVVSGVSYGGIQTILVAAHAPNVRAFVPFAPGAESWCTVLDTVLTDTVRDTKGPFLLIQAKGDYSMAPTAELGPVVVGKGGLNDAKLYPQFACETADNHGTFATQPAGIDVWDTDVMSFIDDALKPGLVVP